MKVMTMHGDPKIENYKISLRNLQNHSNTVRRVMI